MMQKKGHAAPPRAAICFSFPDLQRQAPKRSVPPASIAFETNAAFPLGKPPIGKRKKKLTLRRQCRRRAATWRWTTPRASSGSWLAPPWLCWILTCLWPPPPSMTTGRPWLQKRGKRVEKERTREEVPKESGKSENKMKNHGSLFSFTRSLSALCSGGKRPLAWPLSSSFLFFQRSLSESFCSLLLISSREKRASTQRAENEAFDLLKRKRQHRRPAFLSLSFF